MLMKMNYSHQQTTTLCQCCSLINYFPIVSEVCDAHLCFHETKVFFVREIEMN